MNQFDCVRLRLIWKWFMSLSSVWSYHKWHCRIKKGVLLKCARHTREREEIFFFLFQKRFKFCICLFEHVNLIKFHVFFFSFLVPASLWNLEESFLFTLYSIWLTLAVICSTLVFAHFCVWNQLVFTQFGSVFDKFCSVFI